MVKKEKLSKKENREENCLLFENLDETVETNLIDEKKKNLY